MRTNSHSLVALLFALSVPTLIVACGPDQDDGGGGPTTIDASGLDAGDTAAPPDTGMQLEDTGCPDGATMCNGTCVDLQSNAQHCGACGNACGSGGFLCSGGQCRCIADEATNCDGKCLNLQSDPDNCGACGKTCAGGEKCAQGDCVARTRIEKVVHETNGVRATGYDCDQYGEKGPVADVSGNPELHEAAQQYAETMAANHFLSHYYPPPDCNPDNDGCHDFAWRIRQTDYQGSPVSENIARGQRTAADVVQGWAESDGHCRNMLSSRPDEIGVGYAVSESGTPYWVQIFGKQ